MFLASFFARIHGEEENATLFFTFISYAPLGLSIWPLKLPLVLIYQYFFGR